MKKKDVLKELVSVEGCFIDYCYGRDCQECKVYKICYNKNGKRREHSKIVEKAKKKLKKMKEKKEVKKNEAI